MAKKCDKNRVSVVENLNIYGSIDDPSGNTQLSLPNTGAPATPGEEYLYEAMISIPQPDKSHEEDTTDPIWTQENNLYSLVPMDLKTHHCEDAVASDAAVSNAATSDVAASNAAASYAAASNQSTVAMAQPSTQTVCTNEKSSSKKGREKAGYQILTSFLWIAIIFVFCMTIICFVVVMIEIAQLKSKTPSCLISMSQVGGYNCSSCEGRVANYLSTFSEEIRNLCEAQQGGACEGLEEISLQLLALENKTETLINVLGRQGQYSTFPAPSCAALPPCSPSGNYWVRSSNGSAVCAYCDTTSEV